MESYQLRYPGRPPQKKPRHLLRRFGAATGVLVLVLSLTTYTILALRRPLAPLRPELAAAPMYHAATVPLPWPATGQAAIGSSEQGVVARSHAKEQSVPTASIAKVVTALAVLSAKPIDAGTQGPTITLGAADVELYNQYVAIGGSNVVVQDGEQLTEYDALEALMLPSANNIADSLAAWAFGSMEAYTAYANNMVKQWGLDQTDIHDASGFSDRTVSTPSNLVVIGQKALSQPVLAEIVAKKLAEIPVAGTIQNVNRLLGSENVIGIKTGHTDEAGGCLLFAATQQDGPHTFTVIGAVQGAPNLSTAFTDSLSLLTAAHTGFGEISLINEKVEVGNMSSPWQKQSAISTKQALRFYGWKGLDYTAAVQSTSSTAPMTAGQRIGTAEIMINGQKYSSELVAASTINKPSIFWRLSHYF